MNRPDILGAKQPGPASRNNKLRISSSRQPAQRWQVQVVIMIVADQHGVYARQILPRYSLFSPAPRTYPGQRTRSFGPNWVRQNVKTSLLKEHGRVVH